VAVDPEIRREARASQYRAWLTPAAILSTVPVAIFLYVVTTPELEEALVVAAVAAMLALISFILSLYWAAERLDSVSIIRGNIDEPGVLFALGSAGIAFLLVSLGTLAWWWSTSLGIAVTVVVAVGAAALVWLLRYEDTLD
jgi:hypothetical protein